MNLEELVAAVEETDGALHRVSAAAVVKDQIEALGDELLDHFVKEAREQGCSWTQIGEALGVTRQAAQQRHGGLLVGLVEGLGEAGSSASRPGPAPRWPPPRPRPANGTTSGSAPSTC
jgi:hypothetical protein